MVVKGLRYMCVMGWSLRSFIMCHHSGATTYVLMRRHSVQPMMAERDAFKPQGRV